MVRYQYRYANFDKSFQECTIEIVLKKTCNRYNCTQYRFQNSETNLFEDSRKEFLNQPTSYGTVPYRNVVNFQIQKKEKVRFYFYSKQTSRTRTVRKFCKYLNSIYARTYVHVYFQNNKEKPEKVCVFSKFFCFTYVGYDFIMSLRKDELNWLFSWKHLSPINC